MVRSRLQRPLLGMRMRCCKQGLLNGLGIMTLAKGVNPKGGPVKQFR